MRCDYQHIFEEDLGAHSGGKPFPTVQRLSTLKLEQFTFSSILAYPSQTLDSSNFEDEPENDAPEHPRSNIIVLGVHRAGEIIRLRAPGLVQ